MMRTSNLLLIVAAFVVSFQSIKGQNFMENIPGRNKTSINGQWKIIIDPYDRGMTDWTSIWKDRKPTGKTDFYEYSFEEGPSLEVPGDWNSQLPQLKYYEGTVWYKRSFNKNLLPGKRVFINFGAANYFTNVYVNNIEAGYHEGGFTPFQFEITGLLNEGENSVIVRVNNERRADAIPALHFDWWNYGGLTREVYLIETPETYIDDYFIQLEKGSSDQIKGWIKLAGKKSSQEFKISIPEAKAFFSGKTNSESYAEFEFKANLSLWSPENPKLYKVKIFCETDSISDEIGFRTIETNGIDIFLNGNPVFLKGINFHEEVPQRSGRAYSNADALMLLNWSKELGCNFIRLAHYPQNENIVRMAERMGFMLWEEIPLWQGINFSDKNIISKTRILLDEMITRDKNRCSIILWGMSNETRPAPDRDHVITQMVQHTREADPTRLITSAFDEVSYENNTVTINDTLSRQLDVLAVNQYLGWYKAWPAKPTEMVWKSEFNKPLIMSEFGAEALYGISGPDDVASSWSEEYQAKVFTDQIQMFKQIPFLKGTCPWLLADFRSPFRMHPVFQNEWNRKGLISDKGFRKKAWFVLKDYYNSIDNDTYLINNTKAE